MSRSLSSATNGEAAAAPDAKFARRLVTRGANPLSHRCDEFVAMLLYGIPHRPDIMGEAIANAQ